jgi:hypothetical protein
VALPTLSIAAEIAAVHEPVIAERGGPASVEGEGEAYVEGGEQVFEEIMSPTELIFVGEAL